MKIKILDYRKMEAGKIRGFCNIELIVEGFALTIKDVKVIDGQEGGHFYAFPSKEYVNKEGEKKYFPLCAFYDKAGYQVFYDSMDKAFKDYFEQQDFKEV